MPRKQAAPDDPAAGPLDEQFPPERQAELKREWDSMVSATLPLTSTMIAAGALIGEKYFHEFNPAKWWFDRLARETFEAMAVAGGYVIKAAETEGNE